MISAVQTGPGQSHLLSFSSQFHDLEPPLGDCDRDAEPAANCIQDCNMGAIQAKCGCRFPHHFHTPDTSGENSVGLVHTASYAFRLCANVLSQWTDVSRDVTSSVNLNLDFSDKKSNLRNFVLIAFDCSKLAGMRLLGVSLRSEASR